MIIKCNNCLFEYDTDFKVEDTMLYKCKNCDNVQILVNGVWQNTIKDEN